MTADAPKAGTRFFAELVCKVCAERNQSPSFVRFEFFLDRAEDALCPKA